MGTLEILWRGSEITRYNSWWTGKYWCSFQYLQQTVKLLLGIPRWKWLPRTLLWLPGWLSQRCDARGQDERSHCDMTTSCGIRNQNELVWHVSHQKLSAENSSNQDVVIVPAQRQSECKESRKDIMIQAIKKEALSWNSREGRVELRTAHSEESCYLRCVCRKWEKNEAVCDPNDQLSNKNHL